MQNDAGRPSYRPDYLDEGVTGNMATKLTPDTTPDTTSEDIIMFDVVVQQTIGHVYRGGDRHPYNVAFGIMGEHFADQIRSDEDVTATYSIPGPDEGSTIQVIASTQGMMVQA